MRLVIDTNVVVSGICFPSSNCGQIVSNATYVRGMLWSDHLISEVFQVISRPKLDRYAPLAARAQAASLLIGNGEVISFTTILTRCRDPRDDHLLQLAVDGRATFVVTGDQDLLVIKKVDAIQILTPAQFVACNL